MNRERILRGVGLVNSILVMIVLCLAGFGLAKWATVHQVQKETTEIVRDIAMLQTKTEQIIERAAVLTTQNAEMVLDVTSRLKSLEDGQRRFREVQAEMMKEVQNRAGRKETSR